MTINMFWYIFWENYLIHEQRRRCGSIRLCVKLSRLKSWCQGRYIVTWVNVPVHQAPVVQRPDNAIHRINHYPADSAVCFVNTYPLDSDLSGG